MSWWQVAAALNAAVLAYLILAVRSQRRVAPPSPSGDLQRREQQALEIQDNIVQGLTTAKLALEMDDRDTALRALDETLVSARRIISTLLAGTPAEHRLEAGDLRRNEPAGPGQR